MLDIKPFNLIYCCLDFGLIFFILLNLPIINFCQVQFRNSFEISKEDVSDFLFIEEEDLSNVDFVITNTKSIKNIVVCNVTAGHLQKEKLKSNYSKIYYLDSDCRLIE